MKKDLQNLEVKCLNQYHGFYMSALYYYATSTFCINTRIRVGFNLDLM